MKTQNVLIAHPTNANELGVIKAFFEALKIKFEVAEESPYNPEFVAKIKNGQKEIAEGKGIKMSIAEFKELCK
jgi:hypothetical protein